MPRLADESRCRVEQADLNNGLRLGLKQGCNSGVDLVTVDRRQHAGHQRGPFQVDQRLNDGLKTGATHGVVFSKYGNAILVERGAVPYNLVGFIAERRSHMEDVGAGRVVQFVRRCERRKQGRARCLGLGESCVAAGGAGKAEQSVHASVNKNLGIRACLGSVIAVVKHFDLNFVASHATFVIDGVKVHLGTVHVRQANLVSRTRQRYGLPEQNSFDRFRLRIHSGTGRQRSG